MEKITLRHIIYSIKETLNIYSDDTNVSDEFIAFEINIARSILLKQYLSNLKKPIPLQALSVLCMPLEQDPKCLGNVPGLVLRGKFPLPSSLEATGRSNIHKIYLDNRFAKNLNIIDYDRIPYVTDGEFNHNQIYFTIDPDGYPILYNKNSTILFMEDIKISIVAENPEEAFEFLCDKDKCESSTTGRDITDIVEECPDCDFYDSKYPIPSDLIYQLEELVVQKLTIKYRIPIDNKNDGMDNTAPENFIPDYARRRNVSPTQTQDQG